MIDWDSILKNDGPAAWMAAWRVVGNRADADECFQEACVAALEFSRNRTVRNWRMLLQRLATAKAVDRLRVMIRRKVREHSFPKNILTTTDPAPHDQVELAELSAKLRAALVQIPSRQAEAFCLFYFDGWSYREIADGMAITVDLVGVWLERARDRLRILLSTHSDFSDQVPNE